MEGAVLFKATLAGTAGGTSDDSALYLADGQEVIQVARRGQSVAGTTITSLSTAIGSDQSGDSPVNDNGQVAYYANLANGSNGLFLFTPGINWHPAAADRGIHQTTGR